jgi:hypothetical protein
VYQFIISDSVGIFCKSMLVHEMVHVLQKTECNKSVTYVARACEQEAFLIGYYYLLMHVNPKAAQEIVQMQMPITRTEQRFMFAVQDILNERRKTGFTRDEQLYFDCHKE